jgi:hypothetical protein
MKKQAIIDNIFKHGIFSEAVMFVYIIKFQKWGLSHAHVLVFLKQGEKICSLDEVDSIVWAYWPDPKMQPRLFETVKQCMVHTVVTSA